MRVTTLKLAMLTAVSSVLFAGQAFAVPDTSKIILDIRGDYVSNMYDDDAAGTQRSSSSNFKINDLQVDFQGKTSQKTGYRLRVDYKNSDADAVDPGPNDNLSTFVDMAYISHALTDSFTIMGGKLWAANGGIIGLYDPNEVYLYPKAFIDTYIGGHIYATGFGATYAVAGQTFFLNVTNPGAYSEDADTTTENNKRNAVSARWLGNFMDGALTPTVTYSMETAQNQSASTPRKKLKSDYAAIGLKYTAPVFEVDADYMMNTHSDKTTAGEKDKVNSALVTARYKMNQFRPFVTVESSKSDTATTATTSKEVKTTNFGVGVEYRPSKDEDFRFHAVYLNTKDETTNTGTPSTDQKGQTIIVGMRLRADLLK